MISLVAGRTTFGTSISLRLQNLDHVVVLTKKGLKASPCYFV